MKTKYDYQVKQLREKLSALEKSQRAEIENRKTRCKHNHAILVKSSWVDKGYGLDREYPCMLVYCNDCETTFGSIDGYIQQTDMKSKPMKKLLQELLDDGYTIPTKIIDKLGASVSKYHIVKQEIKL